MIIQCFTRKSILLNDYQYFTMKWDVEDRRVALGCVYEYTVDGTVDLIFRIWQGSGALVPLSCPFRLLACIPAPPYRPSRGGKSSFTFIVS